MMRIASALQEWSLTVLHQAHNKGLLWYWHMWCPLLAFDAACWLHGCFAMSAVNVVYSQCSTHVYAAPGWATPRRWVQCLGSLLPSEAPSQSLRPSHMLFSSLATGCQQFLRVRSCALCVCLLQSP